MFKIGPRPLMRTVSSSDSASKREPLKTANPAPAAALVKKPAVNPFCMPSKVRNNSFLYLTSSSGDFMAVISQCCFTCGEMFENERNLQ